MDDYSLESGVEWPHLNPIGAPRCTWDRFPLETKIQLKMANGYHDAYLCTNCGRVFTYDRYWHAWKHESVVPEGGAIKEIAKTGRAKIDKYWLTRVE